MICHRWPALMGYNPPWQPLNVFFVVIDIVVIWQINSSSSSSSSLLPATGRLLGQWVRSTVACFVSIFCFNEAIQLDKWCFSSTLSVVLTGQTPSFGMNPWTLDGEIWPQKLALFLYRAVHNVDILNRLGVDHHYDRRTNGETDRITIAIACV